MFENSHFRGIWFMGMREPGSKKFLRLAAGFQMVFGILGICTTAAIAAPIPDLAITNIFTKATGWQQLNTQLDLSTLVARAEQALSGNTDFSASFKSLFDDGATQFVAKRAASDSYSTTVRFDQSYKGLEVVGNEAMVHFNANGDIHDVSGHALEIALSIEPTVTLAQARLLLNDRFQQTVTLSEPASLKVFKDFGGKTHLVYHMLTRSTATHNGQEVYLDAHNGAVVLEFDRAYDANDRTVYSADTDKAHDHVDERGYPTDINTEWYSKVIEDSQKTDEADRSALNAYRSAGLVYAYYRDNFNRHSYDDHDARLVSVVHMGKKMNNAFWTNEFHLMAYGDGDGERMTDLTYGLDVAAHELTHGVTAMTAKLVYAAESGALNESYSDFFGKMVDYNGNWDIGARIMSPKWTRRALRNMENPEEFKQPGSNDSKFRIPTNVPCTRANDRCGVHTNSGIPSRAAVLIVQAIGKENAEKLYYKVLTQRLSATSTFKDARDETEKECAQHFGGDSTECRAVTAAFDTVKM